MTLSSPDTGTRSYSKYFEYTDTLVTGHVDIPNVFPTAGLVHLILNLGPTDEKITRITIIEVFPDFGQMRVKTRIRLEDPTSSFVHITTPIPIRAVSVKQDGRTKTINFLPTLKPEDAPLVCAGYTPGLEHTTVAVSGHQRIFDSTPPDFGAEEGCLSVLPDDPWNPESGWSTYTF